MFCCNGVLRGVFCFGNAPALGKSLYHAAGRCIFHVSTFEIERARSPYEPLYSCPRPGYDQFTRHPVRPLRQHHSDGPAGIHAALSSAGWVEHNPNELFDSQAVVAAKCLRQAGITGSEVAAVGIATSARPPSSGTAGPARPYTTPSSGRTGVLLASVTACANRGRPACSRKRRARARRLFFRHESPLGS